MAGSHEDGGRGTERENVAHRGERSSQHRASIRSTQCTHISAMGGWVADVPFYEGAWRDRSTELPLGPGPLLFHHLCHLFSDSSRQASRAHVTENPETQRLKCPQDHSEKMVIWI